MTDKLLELSKQFKSTKDTEVYLRSKYLAAVKKRNRMDDEILEMKKMLDEASNITRSAAKELLDYVETMEV